MLGIVAAIVAIANVSKQKKNAQRSWQLETGRLESQLAAEMLPVLREAGVDALEEIESKREANEKLHADAGRLRQEAIDLDRHADSMFERASNLSSLRRDLVAITQQLAALTDQLAASGEALALQPDVLAGDAQAVNENTRREQERLQKARIARDALQTERFRQLALCASKRAQADSAVAELGDLLTSSVDAQAAVAGAESRLHVADTQLMSLRRDSERLTELPLEPAEAASQTTVEEARKAVSQAEDQLQERRRKRQEVADELARADARLELAHEAAKSIDLGEIEERVAEAQAAVGTNGGNNGEPPDSASARAYPERPKEPPDSHTARAYHERAKEPPDSASARAYPEQAKESPDSAAARAHHERAKEPPDSASARAYPEQAKESPDSAAARAHHERAKEPPDSAAARAYHEQAKESSDSAAARAHHERAKEPPDSAAARAYHEQAKESPDGAAARAHHERAKEQVSSAAATVNLLAAGIPAARRKSEELQSTLTSDPASEFASAEDEERRLYAALRDAEAEVPQTTHDVSPSAQEVRDAGQAAGRAEEELADMRQRAAAATAKRDGLKASAERARGEFEACERQTLGLDLEQVAGELTKARQALAESHPVPDVTPEQIGHAELALEDSDHVLKACEGSLNEVRGKLELVAGRVGLERIEEEQEAVQRAREHAEDQELNYEASKHLLESLEAAETKRSSHLGRCLAAPVTERFLALTGDLYAHVNLDPDLRLEGFVAAGGQHHVEELSVGTREQLATIVRLAIAAQLKTAVLLDDQLVHSDSRRIEWFRKQVRQSVCEHGHQVIVMTCRLSDYAVDEEIVGHEGESSTNGPAVTIINILDVVRRVRALPPAALG